MLPPYLCGPATDGLPKTVGGVVANLLLGSSLDMYNQVPPGNGTTPIMVGTNTISATGVFTASPGIAEAPPASMIFGAFHNGNASTNYVLPTTNPAVIVPANSINVTSGALNTGFVITPGQTYTLAIVTNAPSFNDKNSPVDGFFVYAMDTATGNRVGTFIQTGSLFHYWSACNLDGTNAQVGIAHTNLVNSSSYSGITWQAPATMKGTIMFVGAAVTNGGYGPVAITYNTTTNSTAAAWSTVVRSVPANATAGTAFTALTPMTTTAAVTTVSPGATAGIAVGTAVVGAAIGCGVSFFWLKRRV